MYGKHFESMYDGSMYGAGIAVFAVWGYAISHTRKSRVELNPRKLADTLGGKIEEIEQAISFLRKPDPESRFKEHEGRRMIKEGEFQYFLPSWESHQAIRNADDRREYNRIKQKQRRIKLRDGLLPGEDRYLQAESKGATESELDHIVNSHLPDEKNQPQPYPDPSGR